MSLQSISKHDFADHIQQTHRKSFMQTLEMAKLLAKRGYDIDYVAWKEQETIEISAILYSMPMTGGRYFEINCGPVITAADHLSDFYRDLRNYVKEQGALELVIKPYDTYQTFDSDGQATSAEQKNLITQLTDLDYHFDGLQTDYPNGEGDWHYVKDLSDISEQTLLKSFSKKGRPLVKKAKTFGTKLRRLKRDELHLFKEITSATSNRREYSDKSLDYYQDFYDSFGDKAEFMVASLNFEDYLDHLQKDQKKLGDKITKLQADLEKNPHSEKKQNQLRELSSQFDTFTTRQEEAQEFINKYGKEDVILAGSLFIYTPQEAVYLFSGSYPEFNKFYAPALLQEHVMLEAIKQDISFYNLLGITGHFDGSDGVLRFKQNFNGYIVRKMGTFRYYPKPLKYKAIQAVKKLLGRQ
ncbi:aminoacyltransferase [Streptococcus ratti]|uniref:Aminoacyltransferase FemA n=1 Tax=Streptococcus ratti FA-1 = DSM 20564 TaxID=699248 RepID=A0ABN0GT17_STRRT|nr:aminoacyltransferase [Streptococcus ratti]EJN93506.1 putative peptidoglycan branched peptide synthesis protein [Streptococcus ratti FA-1 = DSM 20564]EMP71747.1 peptidoglycan branched peptide synthesis protein [Streptococcus ratti FA-1 = DSM 20564]QEY07383.1 aminoacyltransferase [Streptococcus ratti]VEI59828.1 peptidoglycan branched peptide synthesis protein [Streptococcus mutans]